MVVDNNTSMNTAWRTRYDAAIEATHKAGQFALRYFDADVAVEWKLDASPVTVADRDAEKLLRSTLLGAFPQDGFLGEEFGDHPGTSGFRWIVDPIDGTRSFVRGVPLWGTLVGLEYQGEPIAGVAAAPALGVTWRALRGDGAYRDERRIHVSKVDNLKDATLFYTSLKWFDLAGKRDHFLRLAGQVQSHRGHGDFYGFVLVAQGSGEIMTEHGVHIWDVAAIEPIITEAGGRYSNWDGRKDLTRPDVVVSNGILHDAALRVLAGDERGQVL
jgi:histidinol-phosphatase